MTQPKHGIACAAAFALTRGSGVALAQSHPDAPEAHRGERSAQHQPEHAERGVDTQARQDRRAQEPAPEEDPPPPPGWAAYEGNLGWSPRRDQICGDYMHGICTRATCQRYHHIPQCHQFYRKGQCDRGEDCLYWHGPRHGPRHPGSSREPLWGAPPESRSREPWIALENPGEPLGTHGDPWGAWGS